jgi:hypothetical protein
MSDKKSQFDLIRQIVSEAKSYEQFSDIEKLIEVGTDLANIPVQPLYMAIHNTSTDQVANILPKLSSEQRQTMLDLDLWTKDVVNVDDFEFWIEAYTRCKEEDIIFDFVKSEDFLLYLRSRVNFWTFDTEDPEYPDHDYYFLTDDSLLLVEYSENFKYPNELKFLIRNLYAAMGVEEGYALLFKMVNDNFSIQQEDAYHAKKERLRDFGFVDYFEAVERLFPFASGAQLRGFIKKKTKTTGAIDPESLNQTLHSSAIISFDQSMQSISDELIKVKSQKRQAYLQFTFIRLVNATITLKDAFKASRLEQTKIGSYTRDMLELGLQYAQMIRPIENDESLLDYFDFMDLYKVGNSLIELNKKQLKKALSKTPFENDDLEYFLGTWWSAFLELSFEEQPKVKNFGVSLHPQAINTLKTYDFWNRESMLFIQVLPMINQYLDQFNKMKTEGKLHDSFYLNYVLDNIDFESILISSFINFTQGSSTGPDVNKLGLTINELKGFVDEFFEKKGNEYLLLPMDNQHMQDTLLAYNKSTMMDEVENFDRYLHGVLAEHLSGYEFDSLEEEDYQHVGGPILLNRIKN